MGKARDRTEPLAASGTQEEPEALCSRRQLLDQAPTPFPPIIDARHEIHPLKSIRAKALKRSTRSTEDGPALKEIEGI